MVKFSELVETDSLDEKTKPSPVFVVSFPVFVENFFDSLSGAMEIFGGDKVFEDVGDSFTGAQSAAGVDAEASFSILFFSDETDIVDGGSGAVVGAARESDFEFSGQVEGVGTGKQKLCKGGCVRGGVEDFISADSGVWAGGDVSDGISTAAFGA